MRATGQVTAQLNTDSRTVVHNSLTLILRQAAIWGVNAVLVLFLPRYLGAEGMGQLQFAVSFTTLFSIGISLGVRQYLIKEVARNRSQAANYLGTAVGMYVFTALVVLATIVGIIQVTGYSSTAKLVVYIGAGTMVALAFARLMAGFLQGYEDMDAMAMAEVIGRVVVVVVGIPVLIAGLGVVAYASVLLAGALVNAGLNARSVSRLVPLSVNFQIPKMRALVSGGIPFLMMGFIMELYNNIDVVMLRLYTQDTVVGWYAAAIQFFKAAELFPLALSTALLPTLARVYRVDISSLAAIARKSIAVGALVIVPLALGLSLLSREIIHFLPYPDTFQNSVPVLRILALTIPATALLTILGSIAIAVDRQKAWAFALLVTVGLNIALNAIAIPYFQSNFSNGGIGASLSTLVCELFMVGVGIWLMPKGVIDATARWAFVKVALAGGAMVLMWEVAERLGLSTILLRVPLAGLTYVAIVLATRAVTTRDIKFLRDSTLKLLRRSRNGSAV